MPQKNRRMAATPERSRMDSSKLNVTFPRQRERIVIGGAKGSKPEMVSISGGQRMRQRGLSTEKDCVGIPSQRKKRKGLYLEGGWISLNQEAAIAQETHRSLEDQGRVGSLSDPGNVKKTSKGKKKIKRRRN